MILNTDLVVVKHRVRAGFHTQILRLGENCVKIFKLYPRGLFETVNRCFNYTSRTACLIYFLGIAVSVLLPA